MPRWSSADPYRLHRRLPLGERVDAALAVAPEHLDQRRGIRSPTPSIDSTPRRPASPQRTTFSSLRQPGGHDGVSSSATGRLPLALHCHRNSPGRVSRNSFRPCVISCAWAQPAASAEQQERDDAHQAVHRASGLTFTVYFVASARTATLRCSASTESVQSCNTTPVSSSNPAGFAGGRRFESHHPQAGTAGQRLPLAGRRCRQCGREVGDITLHDVVARPGR